jgi:hypothetical protein
VSLSKLETRSIHKDTKKKQKQEKKGKTQNPQINPKPTQNPKPKNHKYHYTLLPLPRLNPSLLIELFKFFSSFFPFSLAAQTTFDGMGEGS